jgi:hypothetical protein
MHRKLGAAATALGLVAGCGGTGGERFGELSVVTASPELPDAADGVALDTGRAVRALGAAGSRVVIGTAGGAWDAGEALAPLEPWDGDGAIGAVALLAATETGVLVVADAGTFHTFGPGLVPAPDAALLDGIGLAGIDVPALGQLLLRAERGLGLVTAEGLRWLAVDGESGAPTAAQRAGNVVLAAWGERLYELDLGSGELTRVPYDTGAVHAMAPGRDGAVYLGTARGLVQRDAVGAYTLYTLGGVLEPTALAYYAKDGTFAAGRDGVVVASPADGVRGLARLDAAAPIAAADARGRLWIGDGEAVTAYPWGTPIGFAADVAPILASYCLGCHENGDGGAPVLPLSDQEAVGALGDLLLARIGSGQMPPAGFPRPARHELDLVAGWLHGEQMP